MNSQAAFGPPFFPGAGAHFRGQAAASRGGTKWPESAHRHHLPLLLLAALFAGCATMQGYDGPALPADERAIVRADPAVSAGLPVSLRLRQVDGRDVSLGASAVELTPGAHELLVDCRVSESGSVRRFVLTVELEAGGEYRLVANATARNCEAVELIGD